MVLTETTPLAGDPEASGAALVRLRRLLDISIALNALGGDGLLDYIAETATDVLDCEAASILLFDDATGTLRFEAATGAGAVLVGTEVPVEESLAGATYRDNRILYAIDADVDHRRYREADAQTGFETRALLGVPMRIDGEPVGVLQALNPRRERFDQSDAEALLIIAAQAAVAIRNRWHEAALRHANDQLADLDRLKTNFLSIASHELRTPLAAIHGFGQILAEQVRTDLYPHVSAIVEAGERMAEVVETLDVMASAQSDAGVTPDALVSLAAVVEEAVAAEVPQVALDLAESPLFVEGSRERLGLAVRNLLRNAVQFSEPGQRVTVRAGAVNREIWLVVEDEGIGIDASKLEAVFQAYYQVEDADQRSQDGLGLGLTVARAVFAQHGGRLWAESEGLGQGTSVHARLPLAVGETGEAAA